MYTNVFELSKINESNFFLNLYLNKNTEMKLKITAINE